MIDKLFALDGLERVRVIKELTMFERDDICETYKDCSRCPMAVIYSSRPFCADVSTYFRVKSLLQKGGKFTSREENSDV